MIHTPPYNDNYYFTQKRKTMFDKLLGKNFGADMATKMIVDLMEKAKEEKGTEAIVIMLDEKKEPLLVEYKFRIPERFLQAKEIIQQQSDELDSLRETEKGLLKEISKLKNDLKNARKGNSDKTAG